ncbi:hypothetical protein PS059_24570, partial [Shigella sonnei]|nr:hypothetical protein [Shigella sonnei]
MTEHDGAGKPFTERIRAAATGLYAAALMRSANG